MTSTVYPTAPARRSPPRRGYDPRMTTTPARTGTEAPAVGSLEHADAVELLGLVAQPEHGAFARLAADSALAPTIEQRLELSRFAAAAVERRDRVLARITEIGGDPVAAVRQYH